MMSLTARPTTRRRRTGLLLATLAISVPALAGCAEDGDSATDGPSPSSTSTATEPASPTSPAATPSEEPSEETSEEPSEDTATSQAFAPTYFVGPTPQGARLFREFQPISEEELAASPGGVNVALARSAAGESLDPDYSTLLPEGAPTATTGDGRIQITLPDASWTTRPADLTPREAKLAVQQLVYTAQAVQQERIPVTFLLDGSVSPVLGLDAPEGMRAAKQLNVLALVNLDAPAEAQQVSDTLAVNGVASSFEATVPWELRDAGGAVVLEGFATAEGYLDRLYPFTTEIDVSAVAPGDYVFAALTDDPSDGEGPGPTEDTKAITIQ